MKQLQEIFYIKYGVNLELINCDIVESGQVKASNGVPFVSRTAQNNGVAAFVERIEGQPTNPAHTISVAVSGSVGSSFYHPYEYYSGRDVYVLTPKQKMPIKEMLFYCMIIEKNKYRYNYGRALNRTLPSLLVPEQMLNDFTSMQTPNMPKRKSIIEKEIKIYTNQWQYFYFNDLFNIKGSATTPKDDLKQIGKGAFPFVTTQATNNGIEGFYDFYTEKGNVLTIDSAVVGYCAYQPYDFSASDHVEKLMPKFCMNRYIALFLTAIINKEQYRYNYGRKASQTRLISEKIKLPATPDGQPDWQFMEDYIKSLPYSASL